MITNQTIKELVNKKYRETMTTNQTIEELVNQKFDTISQKIDNIMVRVIDSYILPDSVFDKMIELVDKHIANHKEYGFNLCLKKDNNITNGEECEGAKCSIKIEKSCKDNEEYIGSYHTHYFSFFPSALDLYSGYLDKITCIGDKEKIVCLKKKVEVENKELENYNYKDYKSSNRFVKYISVFDEINNILKTVTKLENLLKKKKITDVEYYDNIKDTTNKLADLVRFNYNIFVYKHGEPLTVEDIEKMQKWEEEQKLNKELN